MKELNTVYTEYYSEIAPTPTPSPSVTPTGTPAPSQYNTGYDTYQELILGSSPLHYFEFEAGETLVDSLTGSDFNVEAYDYDFDGYGVDNGTAPFRFYVNYTGSGSGDTDWMPIQPGTDYSIEFLLSTNPTEYYDYARIISVSHYNSNFDLSLHGNLLNVYAQDYEASSWENEYDVLTGKFQHIVLNYTAVDGKLSLYIDSVHVTDFIMNGPLDGQNFHDYSYHSGYHIDSLAFYDRVLTYTEMVNRTYASQAFPEVQAYPYSAGGDGAGATPYPMPTPTPTPSAGYVIGSYPVKQIWVDFTNVSGDAVYASTDPSEYGTLPNPHLLNVNSQEYQEIVDGGLPSGKVFMTTAESFALSEFDDSSDHGYWIADTSVFPQNTSYSYSQLVLLPSVELPDLIMPLNSDNEPRRYYYAGENGDNYENDRRFYGRLQLLATTAVNVDLFKLGGEWHVELYGNRYYNPDAGVETWVFNIDNILSNLPNRFFHFTVTKNKIGGGDDNRYNLYINGIRVNPTEMVVEGAYSHYSDERFKTFMQGWHTINGGIADIEWRYVVLTDAQAYALARAKTATLIEPTKFPYLYANTVGKLDMDDEIDSEQSSQPVNYKELDANKSVVFFDGIAWSGDSAFLTYAVHNKNNGFTNLSESRLRMDAVIADYSSFQFDLWPTEVEVVDLPMDDNTEADPLPPIEYRFESITPHPDNFPGYFFEKVVELNPGLLIGLTQGGTVLTSTDNGLLWNVSINLGYGTNGVLEVGGAPGSRYALAIGGNSVFRSTDGISWPSVLNLGSGSYYRLAYNGTTWVALGRFNTFASTNDGVSWTTSSTSFSTTNNSDMIWHPESSKFLMAEITTYGQYRIQQSTNGLAWTVSGSVVSGVNPKFHYVNGKLILSFNNSWTGMKYTTNGTSWANVDFLPVNPPTQYADLWRIHYSADTGEYYTAANSGQFFVWNASNATSVDWTKEANQFYFGYIRYIRETPDAIELYGYTHGNTGNSEYALSRYTKP